MLLGQIRSSHKLKLIVLKLEHVLESLGGFIKTQIASTTQEFVIQLGSGGP